MAVEQFFPFLLPPLDHIYCSYNKENSDQPNVKKLREITHVSEFDPVGYLAVQMTGNAKQTEKAGGERRQTHPI